MQIYCFLKLLNQTLDKSAILKSEINIKLHYFLKMIIVVINLDQLIV